MRVEAEIHYEWEELLDVLSMITRKSECVVNWRKAVHLATKIAFCGGVIQT